MKTFLIVMAIVAVVVFVALFFIDAGYGKFYTKRWGPAINNRIGWVLMEAPVFVLMAILYSKSTVANMPLFIAFFALFQLHYLHRSFVFPFLLRGNGRMPLAVILMAVIFNTLNAVMQGGYLFYTQADNAMYDASWFASPQFIIGTIIFFLGMGINHHSDAVIRALRQPGDSRHYLPNKGLYRYVTSANYLGEIVEWCGFALLTWSLSGAVFALWTFANLAPRAARIYKSYQAEFPEQLQAHPRRRLIPYIW